MQTRIEKIDNSKQDTIEDTGWIDCELEDGVSATSSGYGGTQGIKYRKIGNHVYVRGSIAFSSYSGNMVVTTLPYAPAYTNYVFCSLNGGCIAREYVNSSGDLSVEWIKYITDGTDRTGEIGWVSVYIDYWIDLD